MTADEITDALLARPTLDREARAVAAAFLGERASAARERGEDVPAGTLPPLEGDS